MEEERRVLKEHDLMSSIQCKDYETAIELAFELGHSYRLWCVLCEAADARGAGCFDALAEAWEDERLSRCLDFIKEWNTNSAKAAVAQQLLGAILRRIPFSRLRKLPGIAATVEALVPYSERHFQRIDRLVQASFVIDYTCAAISAVADPQPSVAPNLVAR